MARVLATGATARVGAAGSSNSAAGVEPVGSRETGAAGMNGPGRRPRRLSALAGLVVILMLSAAAWAGIVWLLDVLFG